MNARIWGVIGGVALVLALLSPFVLGSAQKVERLFEAAEVLYERSDYEGAIGKYREALKESKKTGARTERINKDFSTLANLKIARCYYKLAQDSSDVRHYQSTLIHIKKVVLDAKIAKHQEELIYLWAETLYKIGNLDQAEFKFSQLVKQFPNSQWVPQALYVIGNINLNQENYDIARNTYQKLVDNFPNSSMIEKAQYIIGTINYKEKNYEEALSTFQRLLEKFPDSEYKKEVEHRITELELLLENPNILEAEKMYNEAHDLKHQGRVHAALDRFTNLTIQFPDNEHVPEAHVQIAEIYLEEKDYVNARIHYEKAMNRMADEKRKTEIYAAYHRTYLVPVYIRDSSKLEEIKQWRSTRVETLVNATRLRADKRFAEAAREYETFVDTNPPYEDVVYALYWAGRCYHFATSTDATLFTKSVGAFRRLITNYGDSPNTIEAYYGLILAYSEWAQKHGNDSKWHSVLNTFKEAKEKFADDRTDLIQQTLRKMVPFKDLAEKAIDNYRENTRKEHYVDQGYLYFGRGELEEAEKKARDAIRLDRIYRRAYQLLEAIKETYHSQGIAALDQNQYEKAITQFNKSLRISPQFKKAFCNLGVTYIEKKEYAKAIESLKKAIDIDSEFKEAYFNLGLAYLRLGNYDYARNAAYDALRIDPRYEPARKLLDSMAD